MGSELSAFCPPSRGVCDLIEASDTPDGPRPGYHTGPPQIVSALDTTGNDGAALRPTTRSTCWTRAGRTRRGVEALLSPLADNGSADQCAPHVRPSTGRWGRSDGAPRSLQ